MTQKKYEKHATTSQPAICHLIAIQDARIIRSVQAASSSSTRSSSGGCGPQRGRQKRLQLRRYHQTYGRDPSLVGGKAANSGREPFNSWNRAARAMSNSRYNDDPGYRAEVEAKSLQPAKETDSVSISSPPIFLRYPNHVSDEEDEQAGNENTCSFNRTELPLRRLKLRLANRLQQVKNLLHLIHPSMLAAATTIGPAPRI
jgi:hypothetical protein